MSYERNDYEGLDDKMFELLKLLWDTIATALEEIVEFKLDGFMLTIEKDEGETELQLFDAVCHDWRELIKMRFIPIIYITDELTKIVIYYQ